MMLVSANQVIAQIKGLLKEAEGAACNKIPAAVLIEAGQMRIRVDAACCLRRLRQHQRAEQARRPGAAQDRAMEGPDARQGQPWL